MENVPLMKDIKISVVVPSYNPRPDYLDTLYRSLLAQSHDNFEVILVDDASTRADYSAITDSRFRILRRARNSGPAACRNAGVAAASTPYVFFTDTDCELVPDTLAEAARHIPSEAIVMGNTTTRVLTPFGKAVALLGFPGGGILGFDQVWRVDTAGYTTSFSSCNLAFQKSVFESLGCFNETFPVAGGEDTVLARKAVESGLRIKYSPNQIVYHVQKDTLRDFIRWQLTRGRGNYHIKQHVASVDGYLKLRVWTFKNSFARAGITYAPWVLILLLLSVSCQILGFYLEKSKPRLPQPPTDVPA